MLAKIVVKHQITKFQMLNIKTKRNLTAEILRADFNLLNTVKVKGKLNKSFGGLDITSYLCKR